MLIRCFDPPALTSWPLLQIRDYVHAQEHDNYKYRTNLPQKSLRIDDLLLLCSVWSSHFLYCCWFSRVTTPHYENKQDAFGALVMMKSEEWLSANVSIVGCQALSSFMKLLSPFIFKGWKYSLGIELKIRVSTKIFEFFRQKFECPNKFEKGCNKSKNLKIAQIKKNRQIGRWSSELLKQESKQTLTIFFALCNLWIIWLDSCPKLVDIPGTLSV